MKSIRIYKLATIDEIAVHSSTWINCYDNEMSFKTPFQIVSNHDDEMTSLYVLYLIALVVVK